MKILIGGKGKMGQLICRTAEEKGHQPLAMVDAMCLETLDGLEKADVLLDFSHRDNLAWISEYVRNHHVPLVYGTTGVNEDDLALLHDLSNEVPVFYATNFSYGVAVLQEILKQAVPLLKDSFDMELVETHHNQKKDAPSGTAKTILSILNPDGEFQEVYGRSGITGARTKEIGVHSLRGGSEAGEHSVHFFGASESITITHHAADRLIFVNGALRAAEYVVDQKPGMYGMQDLIFSKEEK